MEIKLGFMDEVDEEKVSEEELVGPPKQVFKKKKRVFRFNQAVWYVLGIIEALLAFRIVFKALGASTTSAFATLIYAITDPLALPFSGILGVTVSGSSIFEWSTFIGMIVYALLAYALIELVEFIKPVSPDEVDQEID